MKQASFEASAKNLNDIKPSKYYLFSTSSSSSDKKHIESAIINCNSPNNSNGVVFSTWMHLNELDKNADMNSRTMLATPTCTRDNGLSATGCIIPIETWTYVSVKLYPDNGIKNMACNSYELYENQTTHGIIY